MRPKPSPPARGSVPSFRRAPLGLEALEDRSQPATLTLSLANAALVENGPATTATLTRTGDLSQALSVSLANSDATEASVPTSVTIPAGSDTAAFTVSPVDDGAFDGTQTVTLTATAVTGPLTVGYDNTFAGDGVVDTALTSGGSTHPGAVLALPDGKIVAAASTTGFNGWAVYLMNPDGSVVTTSYVPLPNATEPGTVFALARQDDGKILVAGDARTNGVTDWAVARLNPDATVDHTFGTNGALVIPNTGYDSIYDMAVAADGGIIVSGIWYFTSEFRVSRIPPNGGSAASVNIPVYQPAADERTVVSVSDLAIGPDGKIVLAGTVEVQYAATGAHKTRLGAVVRLNADLTPDTSFGPGGARLLTGASFGNYAETELSGVAVLSDGTVVAGGTVWRNSGQSGGEFAAARFNPDGTFDTAFAGDGTATLSLAGGGLDDAEALDLAVQPDGRVVLAGYAWRSGNGTNQALARLTAAGAPDTSFNGTGFFVAADYPAQGSFEQINAVALLPDGRLVAEAGGTTPVTTGNTTTMVSKQWVARFLMAAGETLTATADLTVADDDPALTLSVTPATFAETAGAGAAAATVTRVNASLAADLVVTLASSDTTEATVPTTVTIPAGQASVSFPIAAADDAIPDGTQSATITATASGLTATAGVSVTDDEPPGPALTVTINRTGVLEQTGANAATGTVTRYGFPLDQALTVTLTSNDTTEATVPASVTIPAGQASATFAVTSVDDTFVDGTRPVTITASAPSTALTGPITYDSTWSPNVGWVNGWVNGRVAIAPDGKMVVAGTYGTAGSNADFGVYRYNANGTPDATFGSSGRVQLNPVGPSDQPSAVLVQPDGKVVVAGYGTTSVTASGEMVVVRLRANGTLDPAFDNDGIVRLTFGSGVFTNVFDAALQPDGKILLAGNIGLDFAVVRLNADGTPDTTFDGDGVVRTALSAGAKAYGVAVAPDGKVVAVGAVAEGSATDQRLVVARYTAAGAPDAGFGTGGVVTATVGVSATTYYEQATDVVVQPDGKVVVAASLGNTAGSGTDFAVLRFNADGTPDTGFATNGVYTEAAASAYGGATRVILQPDGRILAAGTAGSYQAGTIRGRFVRLSPAGVFENRADSAWSTSTVQSIAQDSAGNVYLAYNYGSSASSQSGYVDRYRTVGAAVTGSAGLNVLDNEPFAAVNDSFAATEETPLTVTAANGVRSNDTVTAPLSATSVTAELVASPTRGTLTFNADGSFTYTPGANVSGTDTFTYRLRDGIGVSNTATVTINVANVNDAPVAVNDSYTTAEDAPLTVSTTVATTSLSMVSDPGDWIGQGRTYNLSPSTGNFTVSGNATYLTVNYQNPSNTSDYWSLSFRSPFDNIPLSAGTYLNAERASFRTVGRPGMDVTGQHRGSNTLTGFFTILQLDTNANGTISRFAVDFEQHSEGGTPALRGQLRLNYAPGAGPGVLANDSDPDRDPLTVSLVSDPAHGQVALNPDGTFTYTPDPNYNGPDSFRYTASDGTLTSNTATVNLNVTAVNDAPTTTNDNATTAEDAATTIGVLANDTDPEGTALKAVIVTQPANGTATVNASNQIVYTPNPNFHGTDSFTYRAVENVTNGLSGNVATVTVTVTPVNDAPVAQANSYTTDQGVTLSVNLYTGVLANDSDPDGDALTAAVATGPANGVLTLNADGSFSYAPDPAFFGTDSFTYAAADGTGLTATATVTLTVLRTNNPPVAADDAATTNEDTQVGIAVITNDSDPDGDSIRAVVFAQPANGTAVYSANDGRIYYRPNANFHGTDTFTYRAFDGRAYSEPATVTVTVNPVNDAPIPQSDSFSVVEDNTLTVTVVEPNRPLGVLWNDTDAENDPLTVTEVVSGPTGGTVTVNADGSFTYTPRANFSGNDIFYYRVSDGALSGVGQVLVNVIPVNDPPVGNPDTLTATEDTSRTILVTALTGNDTDPEGDVLSIGDFTQPLHGTLTRAVTFNGLIYVPHANYHGPDSFTYRPLDRGQLQGNVTAVTINVAAVNDAPVAQPDSYTLTEDTPLTVAAPGVLANDSDVEGSPLSAVLVTGPSNGTVALNADGSFTYTPRANYSGTDSFTYTASDGQAQGAAGVVSLTVAAVNDAPVALPDSYTVAEDGTLTVTGGSGFDQQSVGGNTRINAAQNLTEWQQGVKAGFAGTLASFDLYVEGAPGSVFDVFVNRGAPRQTDADEFSTQLVVTQAVINQGWITFDVSAANIQLAAGEVFTIGARNGFGDSAYLAASDGSTGDSYPDGRLWRNSVPMVSAGGAGFDLKFRTRMTSPAGVLANDTDADGNSLSAVLVSGPSHGTVSLAANGGFTYTPTADYNGPDSFTYKASDGTLDSPETTVSIAVTAVNDAPLAAGDTATADEDAAVTVAVLANDTDPDGGPLSVTAVTQGANGTVTFTAAGTVYTPNPNFFGTDSFAYTVSDGNGGSATGTVAVTVTAVDDAPTLNPLGDLTVAEDAGARTVSLAGITAGPGESQSLTVTARSDNPALLPDPTVAYAGPNSTGTLTFAPVADKSGTATVTVTVSDGQLTTSRTFAVTVAPVNDPPTLAALADLTIPEDAGARTVDLTGIAAGPNESQTLTVTAVSSNPALIPNPTVGYTSPNSAGTLTFAPVADASGTATVTVTVSDGDRTVTREFAVTVLPVNDAPSFTPGANQTVTAGAGPQTIAGWATNVSRGPADEAAQGLTFVVTTTNPGLFVAPPTIDPATGALAFIPEAGASGTATVTVVLGDDGGTANGGADTSAVRTFTITVNPNGLPTTPGIRKVGTELVITGADTNDTVTVTQQGNGAVKVNATLNGKKYNNQSFSGVTRIRVDAEGGNDTISFAGVTTIPTWTDAGAGDDTVTGGGGADQIYLGAGTDTADGGAGDDLIAGGAGEDLIQGGAGNDQLYGGDDDDFVIGGPGVDQLFGQAGNDILVGGSASVRSTSSDSLRKVLTDWNPASGGVGGYADIRNRLVITDDGATDPLTGGTGIDWFWEPLFGSVVDPEPGEQRN